MVRRPDGPGSGVSSVWTLTGVVERIAASPLAFPRAHKETRRAVVRRFPYAIYFRIAEETVVVLAVHGRQHPARWRSRIVGPHR